MGMGKGEGRGYNLVLRESGRFKKNGNLRHNRDLSTTMVNAGQHWNQPSAEINWGHGFD